MKKKVAACAVLLSVGMALTGCSSNGPVENDYIKITQYKGIEVPAVEGYSEITDTAVDNKIEEIIEGFAEYTEVTDRPVQEGDTIYLSYSAVVDGEVLEDKSESKYQASVGNGSLYDGFDEDVIGLNVGDSYVKSETYDEDYEDEDLAGKTMDLTITITNIYEKELADLTDDFVQTISQKSETVDEYKEEVRALLEEANEEAMMSELMESVWSVVLENTEVKEYPQDLLDEEVQELYDYYQQGADVYEMEFADFLVEVVGTTEEEFAEKAQEAAESNVKEDLIVALICEKEGISLTDEEMEAAKEELAEEMEYEDVEAMLEDAGEEAVEKYILRDAVKEWLADNCIQVKE